MTVASSAPALELAPLPDGLDTPCLVVDLDVVERNIGRLAVQLRERSVSLRPHAKTHKSVAVARMQLDAGARGVTVGTIGEAEVFAAAGIRDLFLAYTVWAAGPKAARLRAVHEAADLSVGVDSADGARALAAAVAGASRRLRVLVEVDSGYHRAGVTSAEEAARVARAARDAGLAVVGVFSHAGQGYAGPDAREAAARDEVASLAAAAEALRAEGFDVERISAGSTPTMLGSAIAPVNEMRAGTYVFGDRQQVVLGSIEADSVAAVVAATVVSGPAHDRYVLDAGAKILTKDRADFLAGYGLIADDPAAVIERVNDYHGIVGRPSDAPGEPPAIGDVMTIVPNHICPVVNLLDDFVVTRGGRAVGRWLVDARGRNG